MNINDLLKRIAFNLGYDVRRLRSSEGLRSTLSEAYQHLFQLGFRPDVVIDVGVASGSYDLYTTFPDSFFILVEPVKEFEAAIKKVLETYQGKYILAAAGAETRQVTFNVHQHQLEGSSLLKETMGIQADGFERTVPMIQLDDLRLYDEYESPYLIKVDVQGGELEVVKGAEKTLSRAEVVVLEVSMFQFQKGAPEFYDVVNFMKLSGFDAYDIILGWNRPYDNALGQIDMVFVKENGLFRKSHVYASPEQLKKIFGPGIRHDRQQ